MWSECCGRLRDERICFFICDDDEGFGIYGSHWEFLWVCDNFIFDSDRGGWIEEFDGDENLSIFYW